MQTRIPEFRAVLASFAAVLLVGCGGGSSGGVSSAGTSSPSSATTPPVGSPPPSASPPPSTSATSFPLSTSLATVSTSGLAANLKVSGTIKGISVSGTGSFIESAAIAATFAGQAALQQAVALNATVTANIIPATYTYSTMADMYTNGSYDTVGLVDTGEYDEAVAPFAFPASVASGDDGTLGTMNRYSDSTKTTLLGTMVSTYKVEAGPSANTAIFDQIDQSLDANHNVTATVETKYQITSTGGISLAAVSVVKGNANLSATAV